MRVAWVADLRFALRSPAQLLRLAGVKFWMLTGDKQSTALQVATACNLKSADERSIVAEVKGADAGAVGDCIRQHLRQHVREQVLVEGYEHNFTVRGWQCLVLMID